MDFVHEVLYYYGATIIIIFSKTFGHIIYIFRLRQLQQKSLGLGLNLNSSQNNHF
jgi:hypothetical protein